MTNPSLDWQFPFQGRFAGKRRSEPIRSEREVWTDRTIEGAARRPALDAAINERPKWTHDAVLFKDHAGTGLL
jgi:hypothetical protein